MTLSEARKILGLGPEDDPRPFLNEFKEARERIAEMVRTAPNDTLAGRYQQGLVDFDRALAAVREHLEAIGLAPRPSEMDQAKRQEALPPVVVPAEVPAAVVPPVEEPAPLPVVEEKPFIPEPAVIAPAAEPVITAEKITPPEVAPEIPEALPPANPPLASFPAAEQTPAVAAEPIPPVVPEVISAPVETPAPKENPPAPVAVVEEPKDTISFTKPAAEPPAFVFEKAHSLPASAPPLPKDPEAVEKEKDADVAPEKSGRAAKVAWLLTVILLCIAGMFLYLKREEDLRLQKLALVIDLGKKGDALIDTRNWPEATRIFDQIEKLTPESSLIAEGRGKIAAGMAEEQSQFVSYGTGQAKASMEAKRWDEATAAAQQVLDRFPNEQEAIGLLKQINEAKAEEADRLTLASARDMLQQRKWDEAIAAANKILAVRPADDDAKALLADASAARDKAAADAQRAKALLGQARASDKGQFDQALLDLLREAAALAPEDPEIKAQLEKLASYSRTLRVPGDFATPAEALAQARDRDRIIIAAGTWEGPLVVSAAVDLQGAGPDTTIIQCAAQKGCAITLGAGAKAAHVTGFTFRHQSFDAGEERFSAGLVRGVPVDFVDCRFQDASGHGLAVIEGGHATVSRCRFADNGWNGVAASGPGTLLEVRQSESLRNFGHGIESWDGAAIILSGNRCDDNSRNGVHADNGGGSVSLEKNQFSGNREFGVVLSSAGSGRATGNIARDNLLGGYAIRNRAAGVAFSGNEATKNNGPGLILDLGLVAASYAGNVNAGNMGQQVLLNANLTVKDEPAPEIAAPPKAAKVEEGQ